MLTSLELCVWGEGAGGSRAASHPPLLSYLWLSLQIRSQPHPSALLIWGLHHPLPDCPSSQCRLVTCQNH